MPIMHALLVRPRGHRTVSSRYVSAATRATRPPLFPDPPAVIGHRGLGSGVVDGLPENSLASMSAAVAAGVDWVELDVSRSSEDVLVVHHNPATLEGAFLVECTAPDLSAMGVAALQDVLDGLPGEVAVDIDVKPVLEDALTVRDTVELLLPLLRREQPRRRLMVTSFDATALQRVRAGVPGLPTGLLTWFDFPLRIAVPMAARLGVDVVGLHHRSFAANTVEPAHLHREPARNVTVAHEAGLEVLAWCPGPEEVPGLVAAGVDALVVNDVPTMLPLVRSLAPA